MREAIDLLSSRVVQLCNYITSNGLQAPAIPEEDGRTLKTILDSLGLHEAVQDLAGPEASVSQGSRTTTDKLTQTQASRRVEQSQRSEAPSTGNHTVRSAAEDLTFDDTALEIVPQIMGTSTTWPSEPADTLLPVDISSSITDFDVSNSDLLNPTTAVGSTNQSKTIGIGDVSDGGGSNEDLVDELSHRVGTLTIGLDGRTKLRGPSSIYNIESAGASRPRPQRRAQSTNTLFPANAQLNSNQVPEHLQDHLLDLYFELENPTSDFVDQVIFTTARLKDKRGEDSAYYSDALCNAM